MQLSLSLVFDIVMLTAACSLISVYLKNKFTRFRMLPLVTTVTSMLVFLAGLSNTAIKDFKMHSLSLHRVAVAVDSYSYVLDFTSMLAQISTITILALFLTKLVRKIDWD